MKILIVDDEQKYRAKYESMLEGMADVLTCNDPFAGAALAAAERPDIVLTDKDMPGMSGSEMADKIRQVYNPVIIGITGGNPGSFGPSLDMRLSKTVSDQYVTDLFTKLTSGDPRAAVDQIKAGLQNESSYKGVMDLLMAVHILAQGYHMSQCLISGRQYMDMTEESMAGLTTPTPEKAEGLLNLADVDIDPQFFVEGNEALRNAALTAEPEKARAINDFLTDDDAQEFLVRIGKNERVEEQHYMAFLNTVARILGGEYEKQNPDN